MKIAKVDYNQQSTLVDALRGQDVLVITTSVRAPKETQLKLIEAAAAAGVPYVLPNAWCPDAQDEDFADDILMGEVQREARALIEKLGVSSWITMITGHWYEFSLGGGAARYGLDWKNKTFTFFDDGLVKMNVIVSLPSKPARVMSLSNHTDTLRADVASKWPGSSKFAVPAHRAREGGCTEPLGV